MTHVNFKSTFNILFSSIWLRHIRKTRGTYKAAKFLALTCLILAFPRSILAGGFEVYGGIITERDKQSLPPVCRLILFEKPSAHQPEGQRVNGDLFSLPEYRMAKNNIHLHHYCYGLLSRYRYFSVTSKADRDLFTKKFQDELDYVIVNQEISDKSWPYFDLLYYEQAEMLFITNKYPEATAKALKALSITPSYAKAHALLSDIHMKMGKRDLALKQLREGLAANLSSKPLRRRLREIDPKDPLLSQSIPEPPQPTDTTASKEPDAVGAKNTNKPLPTDDSSSGDQAQEKPISTPAVTPNPSNPYCRFCP